MEQNIEQYARTLTERDLDILESTKKNSYFLTFGIHMRTQLHQLVRDGYMTCTNKAETVFVLTEAGEELVDALKVFDEL